MRIVREPLEVLTLERPEAQNFILVDGLDESLVYGGVVGIVQNVADHHFMNLRAVPSHVSSRTGLVQAG